MTTQKLPGSDAARHGTGDADLAIMLAAHGGRCVCSTGLSGSPATPKPRAG